MENKRYRSFLSAAAMCAAAIGVAQAPANPAQPPVTLHVGDLAPSVPSVTRLKGLPLGNLADGSVHVIEFWATWCGPCKAAMPELSQLAQEYKGRVSFTGIDVWESHSKDPNVDFLPKVRRFVDSAHGRMAYNVGADDLAGDMAKTWLTAAGQHGIPCTFIVDGQGRIAYIGHPVFLSEVLPSVLDHTFDEAAFQASRKAAMAKIEEFWKQRDQAAKAGDAKQVLVVCDEIDRSFPWASNDDALVRYATLATGSPVDTHSYGEELIKRFWNDPQSLCLLSRIILGEMDDYYSIKALGGIKSPDYALALKAAKEAQKCSDPMDVLLNMTLAEAYFRIGNASEASGYQAKVVDEMEEDKAASEPQKMIDDAKKALNTYQAAARASNSTAGGRRR